MSHGKREDIEHKRVGRASRAERRARAPSVIEIERALGNARHYLDLLRTHEAAAQTADSRSDAAQLQESKNAFFRDLEACLNAGRTARNYLYAAAEPAGARAWLDERLAAPLYKFHADVAGTDFHDRAISLSNSFGVEIHMGSGSAQFEMINMPDGAIGVKGLTKNVSVIPRRFIYNRPDLGPKLDAELEKINPKPEPIVELLQIFLTGLQQILKNAVRNNRF
ncbi:MAG TPA: hypothetical protein VFO29_01585 [Candidatus Rubrimentiphilum sp.]|nr:hypothetical protein [Candidatus Rubrimentiphilum sp.]